jgi:hypothetical protein
MEGMAGMQYLTLSLSDLSADSETEARCHCCGAEFEHDDDDRAPPRVESMFLWVRGTERRPETVSICVHCGTANAVTAFARFQAHEEEG